jgi:hypothetical protein
LARKLKLFYLFDSVILVVFSFCRLKIYIFYLVAGIPLFYLFLLSETASMACMDEYGQFSCDPDEFIKEPPELPPHFRQQYLPLNHISPNALDMSVLPAPSHVLLNHVMYGSRIITTGKELHFFFVEYPLCQILKPPPKLHQSPNASNLT